ncbi:hypothetical protein T265_04827 [Opisthorchis viverrini]|uniref:Uncharacterized protein n=1 Tax=Opisthorchis viverrini TaxID=6198 RepID=A0A075AG18_OPIVI|nr:hypothetical protein T265_04827 [Opisthorchis viverrini]KER28294.1 hypothetical protein T265_04827 [Opisthorchis viverrini]
MEKGKIEPPILTRHALPCDVGTHSRQPPRQIPRRFRRDGSICAATDYAERHSGFPGNIRARDEQREGEVFESLNNNSKGQ